MIPATRWRWPRQRRAPRGIRPGWVHGLGGSGLLLIGALLSCANAGGGDDRDFAANIAGGPAQANVPWVDEPPRGCAVGFSGPTLNPGDAIRTARRSALETLASASLPIEIQSELRISGEKPAEVTTQAMSGVLHRSRIVAMGSAPDSVNPHVSAAHGGMLREVYALACPADVDTPGIPEPAFPDWIMNIESEGNRVCVPGIGGPTRQPRDQPAAALRDGRDALAHALESRIGHLSVDGGRGYIRQASTTAASERAIETATGVDALAESWLDESGEGPLHRAGILYALVCVEY